MKSGPRRVSAPLEGTVIPRSRRNLFKDQSFAYIYNSYTSADKWPAGDAAGKVRGGEGRGLALRWGWIPRRHKRFLRDLRSKPRELIFGFESSAGKPI